MSKLLQFAGENLRLLPLGVDIDLLEVALIWAGILVAAVLRTFTGFGFALSAVPVLAMFLPPSQAVVMGAALTLAMSALRARSNWGVVSARELAPLVSMSLLGTIAGASVLTGLSVARFQLFVGVSVLLACVGITFLRPGTLKNRPAFTWSAGLLSGLMNGALAIPGPPLIIYAMMTHEEPIRSRGLLMIFFMISAFLALMSYGVAGIIEWQSAWYFVLAIPALVVGDRLGNHLFVRHGDAYYRRVAIIGLAAIGIAVTTRALL